MSAVEHPNKAKDLRRLKEAQRKRPLAQHPPRLLVFVGIPGKGIPPNNTFQTSGDSPADFAHVFLTMFVAV